VAFVDQLRKQRNRKRLKMGLIVLLTVGPLLWLAACIQTIDSVDHIQFFSDAAGLREADPGNLSGHVWLKANVSYTWQGFCEADPPNPVSHIGILYSLENPAVGYNSVFPEFDTRLFPDGTYQLIGHAYAFGPCDTSTGKDSDPVTITIHNAAPTVVAAGAPTPQDHGDPGTPGLAPGPNPAPAPCTTTGQTGLMEAMVCTGPSTPAPT
jgi:hypothetical protein